MRTFAHSYSWTKYYSQNISSNVNQWNSCIKLFWKKRARKKGRKKKVVVEDKGFGSTIHLFSGQMFTALTITDLRCPDSASVGFEDHWNRNISSFDRTQTSKIWKAKVIYIFFEFASFSKILSHKNRIAFPLQQFFRFSSLKITIRKTELWLQLYDILYILKTHVSGSTVVMMNTVPLYQQTIYLTVLWAAILNAA